ncbi:Phosphatidylinositol transfer protein 2-like protein [Drosera capensis]
MVQMKEFRIVMPVSLEEYEIAQMYMVVKMQQENTTSTEGVEILESRPFEDDVYGKAKCPLGSPLLHQEMLLFCMRKLGVHIQDANQCPCFNKLVLTIETVHVADNAKSENVHGLDKEQLESRKVEVIDIASSARDHWSYLVGRCDVDFSKFRSRRTGRGPLTVSWKEQCNPVMTAYKLVTVDAPYWGFGKRLEQTFLAGERALFLETHRSCFAWIDQWYGMTLQQLQDLEQEYYSLTSKVLLAASRMYLAAKLDGSKI